MSIQLFTDSFKKLDLSKDFAGVRLPSIKIEPHVYSKLNLKTSSTNLEILTELCRAGFKILLAKNKVSDQDKVKYSDRVKLELELLEKLKFTDYMLIIWDVINFCKENRIPHGLGRGSAAGSLVLYLIGVTGLDPLKYDLLFERFISPSRCKYHEIDGEVYLTGAVPDIDLDIDYLRRHEVAEYIAKKYPNRTAKILNLTTLTGKNLIKEAGKIVYDKSESEMHEVSEMIPAIFGKVSDISEVYKDNPKFKKWCDDNPLAYKIALKLRDLIKNKSVHASGIAISKDEITDICPIELTSDKELVCSFNMNDAADFMIKVDLLGLKTLSLIDGVCKQVNISDMRDIDFEHPDIYTYLCNVPEFYGIFQLEANTALSATQLLKPQNLEYLSHVMAIARPGAMSFMHDYLKYKTDETCKEIYPTIDPILNNTHGFILYQEQIMKIINALGFTLEQGYEVVKIIGKKQREKVGEWEEKIYKAAQAKNIPKQVAALIWNTLKASADYSFNRSHSHCYSATAAITAYLKCKFPKEFFLSALRLAKAEQNTFECISRINSEMKQFGIKMLPPDIRIANEDFMVDKQGIRFGLSAIKGISEKKLEKLRQFNCDSSNKFALFESAKHARVDIATLSGLIQAGALATENESRTRLVLEAQLWNLLTNNEKAYCIENGKDHAYDLVAMVKNINEWTNSDGKNISRSTRLDTIRKRYEPFKKIYEQNSKYEDLASWFYEKTLLGFPYSKTLKQVFLPVCQEIVDIGEIKNAPNKTQCTFIAIVDRVKSGRTKKGDMYSKFDVSDENGKLLCFLFEPNRSRLLVEGKKILPKEGEIYAFRGTKSGDLFTLYDFSLQSNKVFLKLSDVKIDNE
jgi:DNA polymerase III subunit alpha